MFSENLQNLRKMKSITQEELAEKLDVSRQAVSKWESGNGYPEMNKLVLLAEIFGCSLDRLINDKIVVDTIEEKQNYNQLYNRFSIAISGAIAMILAGTTGLIFLSNYGERFAIFGVIVLLVSVLLAVPLFIYFGLEMESFKKANKQIANVYSEDEVRNYNKVFVILLCTGIALILIGVTILVALYGLELVDENSTIPVGLLLVFVTIGTPMIVYAGIQKAKYDIEAYNKEAIRTKNDELIGKISGVIMLSATALFLIAGFLFNKWGTAWVVFPIGGILCGIVGTIFDKNSN
ncbi:MULTISPECIES: helix-turn-helix transcriptional regulator [unclassified Enterococcus]|uniref:helix-turn-helix domain-containing protein n=1 Tax=unclassified Enterococcus TaxID=2608891 RepID=UPI001555A968|nr:MULTISPECIES: helix-turn-helix transcriptional regulator [unclassified Enterococcus]MBS7577532.1 helix-turn-helix transcriptional regulator [Enterococcus sp. MMGLQ5-2]MBS7584969.1 helix-turn-helix transcriptional regulator [Enterococcus sp. MMGLQ5-1]NPD12824.1 helix-turn-helix transcriptional regulator [Enterococcus sp. MMGLQ5-1]NPD37365.1 helix-turn-helix transcriptional regulator [Enterococcus sp. MMGLQ5-2]